MSSLNDINSSFIAISNWLSDNYLKINQSKTEVIIVGTPTQVSLCKSISTSITLGNSNIDFSTVIKNLGVTFDESLSFLDHIKFTRKNAFNILNSLRHIRGFFDQNSFKTIVLSLISTKLDYCNSLFSNLPSASINLLQSIQNYAARLICHRNTSSHVTPLLKELHWLPVRARIDFKILLITYKALFLSSPPYLASLLSFKARPSSLRQLDHLQLNVPRSKSVRMGDRSFSIVAPRLWNSLPLHIRQASNIIIFKTLLKTYIFNKTYNL